MAHRLRHQNGYRWEPYVRQGTRRAAAAQHALRARRDGVALQPVAIKGRKIATSFWGMAWCESLEQHCDFSNRLPRGRTYARNGSVIDLRIDRGVIDAQVSGSSIYRVKVQIGELGRERWQQLVADCSGAVGSLLELLQGRFSHAVMAVLTRPATGLFPAPAEMSFACSCPDYAAMCKHVAAVLYGIGARLDRQPDLLFTLRGVDGADLIAAAAGAQGLDVGSDRLPTTLAGEDLGAVFGIDLESTPTIDATAPAAAAPRPRRRPTRARPPAAAAEDDGFAAVFGEGLEVTAALLAGFGVGAPMLRRWLTESVLLRTRRRDAFRTTPATLACVRAAFARSIARR